MLYENVFSTLQIMQDNKTVRKKNPHPKWDQNMVMSAFGDGGDGGLSASAMCLACKWYLRLDVLQW